MTLKTFTNYDKYNPKDAPDRHNRRRMEAENKKRRSKARKEYIDTVQNLVYFIKKRDPRVKAMEQHAAEQKEAENRLAAERKAQQAAEYKRAREEQLQQLSSDDDVDELVLSDEEQLLTYRCSVVIVFEDAEQTHSGTGDTEKVARLAAATKAIAALASAKQFQSKKGKAALRGNAVAALNKLWQKNILADKPEYICVQEEEEASVVVDTGHSDEDKQDEDVDQEQEHQQDQEQKRDQEQDWDSTAGQSASIPVDDRSSIDHLSEEIGRVETTSDDELEYQMLNTPKDLKTFKKELQKTKRGQRQAWNEPEPELDGDSAASIGTDVDNSQQGECDDDEENDDDDEIIVPPLGLSAKDRKKWVKRQHRLRRNAGGVGFTATGGSENANEAAAVEQHDNATCVATDKRRARVEHLRAQTDRAQAATETDSDTAKAIALDDQPTPAQESEDMVPACTCASCILGGKCINEMTAKEKKKFDKQQAAAEKARLWREEHGEEEEGEGSGEGAGEAVVPTKKDKKKKKLAKVEKKGDRKRAGRCKT